MYFLQADPDPICLCWISSITDWASARVYLLVGEGSFTPSAVGRGHSL